MLNITSLTLGELQTNCYFAWCDETYQTAIIDPAAEGTYISEQLVALELEPVAIILTHGHFDHVLGILEVKLNFPNAPIMMNPADQFLLDSIDTRVQHWLGPDYPVPPLPPVEQPLHSGDIITIGEESLTVLATPGHTPGSICLYDDVNIFTGDTLFRHGVGRTDLSYSSAADLHTSLDALKPLAAQRYLWPGHE